ncbi:zinc ABC transporter substrate-binding protein [candidate division KSB1 bacterium]|nr:zinc ABC transporter substrate-binding protein [candidate division KSB1 bacterium]
MKICKLLLLIILSFLFFTHCGQKTQPVSNQIRIAASITPIADFVQQVVGERAEVFTVVPPGTDPHTFELTPELMKKISDSHLLVLNGVGLEFWAEKVSDNIKRENFIIVDTSTGINIIQELHHDDKHPPESGNPHIWLDPLNAIRQVENIRDALVKLDRENRDIYETNAKNYIVELKKLDQKLNTEINSWKRKEFVCFHPAWEYFAHRYGLRQAGVIEKSPGSQPGPQEIAEIIETVKLLKVNAIFAEAQFPDNLSKSIAQESGIRVIPLDPIGASQNLFQYMDMMSYNVAQMASVLKE